MTLLNKTFKFGASENGMQTPSNDSRDPFYYIREIEVKYKL